MESFSGFFCLVAPGRFYYISSSPFFFFFFSPRSSRSRFLPPFLQPRIFLGRFVWQQQGWRSCLCNRLSSFPPLPGPALTHHASPRSDPASPHCSFSCCSFKAAQSSVSFFPSVFLTRGLTFLARTFYPPMFSCFPPLRKARFITRQVQRPTLLLPFFSLFVLTSLLVVHAPLRLPHFGTLTGSTAFLIPCATAPLVVLVQRSSRRCFLRSLRCPCGRKK